MILVIDESQTIGDRDNLISHLVSEGNKITRVHDVRKVPSGLTSGLYDRIEVERIIYHCSGREGVSEEEAAEVIKVLLEKKGKATLIVVSVGPKYQKKAKSVGGDIVTNYQDLYSDIEEIVKKENLTWTKGFRNYCERMSKKQQNAAIISYILHIFLPLDIDMQAIDIIAGKKWDETGKDPDEYLKAMFEDKIDYSQKCEEFRKIIGELAEYRDIDKQGLGELCDKVEQFLVKLRAQASAEKPSYNELQTYDWGLSDIESFHDWYCALAECLRSHEK